MTSMCLYWKTLSLLFAGVCVPFKTCLSAKTSQACYGVQGLPCTKHTLECSSGMIAIQDAYYTNSTACTSVGLPNCNISISTIPDTGRYQNFSETQLNNLYGYCSNQRSCTFNGVRQAIQSVIAFSIVKFICTNGDSSVSCSKSTTTHSTVSGDSSVSRSKSITTHSTVPVSSSTTVSGKLPHQNTAAGAVAGGVVSALVVIAAVVAFVLWLKFKRNKEPRVKSEKPSDSYSVVTPRPKNVYSAEVTTKTSSNYDYATVHDGIKSTGHVRIDDYYLATTPVEKRKAQNGEASRMDEDDYNHLDGQNKIVSNGDKPPGYDTSASAIAAVRMLQNMNSYNREGDYNYNHLGDNFSVKPVRDDYDTAATASRAVALMVKDKDTAEDDYDHFHKTEIKSLDSPYDTTEQCMNETDSSLTGTENKNDPYDLAK